MIAITTCRPDYSGMRETKFQDAKSAVRFIYKMKNDGCRILDFLCDDPEDAEAVSEAM